MRILTKLSPVILFFFTLVLAHAQSLTGLTCVASSSTPFDMRAEGITEQTGDVVVVCTGGTPTPYGAAVPQVNLTVTANAGITSRLVSLASSVTDAVVLMDDPVPAAQAYCPTQYTGCAILGTGFGGGVGNNSFGNSGSPVSNSPSATNPYSPSAAPGGLARYNVYGGVLSGFNIVTFFGVPIDPPGPTGGTLSFRISNIRLNVSSLGAPAEGSFSTIAAFQTISSSAGFTINSPVQTVGNVRSGMTNRMVTSGTSATSGTPGSISQCVSTPSTIPLLETVSFREGFSTANKLRLPTAGTGSLSTPGNFLNTESQFVLAGTLPSPLFGQADSGTRIKLTFRNLQPGVQIFVPTAISSATNGTITGTITLTSNETGSFAPPPASNLPGVPFGYAALITVNGAAEAVYEVTSQGVNGLGPLAIENYSVPVAVSYAAPSPNYTSNFGPTTVSVDYAPNTNSSPSASTGSIPRFVPSSNTLPGFVVSACTVPTGPPIVTLDPVTQNSGMFTISGWALDNTTSGTAIQAVGITIDGTDAGTATYGLSRPDVCATYPDRPNCPNVGFTYTGPITPGAHTIGVNAKNSSTPAVTGSASVSVKVGAMPTVVSVTPSSGSGISQVFTAVYSDAGGATAISRTVLGFASSFTNVNGCFVQMYGSAIYLLDDSASFLLGPISTTGPVSNTQCTLNSSGSGVINFGNTATANISLTFKVSFNGPKSIYLLAEDVSTESSGYQLRGTFTVNVPSVPAVVSVSPNTSTAPSQSFVVYYTDTGGATILKRRLFLINSVLQGPNSCFVQADATGIYLVNDAGSGLLGPVNSGISISNSQCTLNGTYTSVSNYGTDSYLYVTLTFSPSFTGLKSIFLYADDPSTNSGWVQLGSITVPATSIPATGSVSPNAASGTSQIFTAAYSDPAGTGYLKRRLLLINSSLAGAGACFVQADAAGIYLVNDAGSGLLGPLGSGTLSNNQCTLIGSGTNLVDSGSASTLTASIAFKASFSGAKNMYLYTEDSLGNSTGFQNRGTYTIAFPLPSADSLTPSSGSGTFQYFTASYSDSAGATAFNRRLFLINSSLNGTGACFVQAGPGGLYLVDDAGSGLIGPMLLTGSSALSNSQCTLNLGSYFTVGDTSSSLSLSISFQAGFYGPKNIYMYAEDKSGNNTGFQLRGTYNVSAATPSVVSVSPASSFGLNQSFTAVYSDASGAGALNRRLLLINSSLTGGGACFVQGDASGIYLVSDTGLTLIGPVSPGGTVANTQCSVSGTGSSLMNAGTTSTLTVSLTFKPIFSGTKNIYLYADDSIGHNSGFQSRGTYTVLTTPSIPVPASVSPSSGSGANQTFTLNYADPAGNFFLNRRLFLIAPVLNGSAACLVEIDSNGIYLANDLDSALIGPLFLNSSLNNSQCTLSGTGASVSYSQTGTTVVLPVAFKTSFAGPRNLYMYADDTIGNNSGWQLMGTWTAQ